LGIGQEFSGSFRELRGRGEHNREDGVDAGKQGEMPISWDAAALLKPPW
jgi:hypothetical protein